MVSDRARETFEILIRFASEDKMGQDKEKFESFFLSGGAEMLDLLVKEFEDKDPSKELARCRDEVIRYIGLGNLELSEQFYDRFLRKVEELMK